MIYTTGTIAVSGNTLTGTGTNFTAAGSLIRNGCTVIAMTSPVQVFQITAIGGATSLTVTPAANPAIPAGTKYAILLSDSLSVDGLAQDIAETFTMYQRYMSGFADVMNGTTDVTITINGVAVTVPGQKSLAKKGANSDITSLSGLTTALSIEQGGTGSTTASGARTNLGLGNSATRDVGTAAGTVAAGDDLRLGTVNGKTGGTLNSGLSVPGAGGFTVKAGVFNGDSINNAIVVTNISNVNPAAGDWVNFLRGGWWSGEWTIGALRTGGASIKSVQIALRADNSSPFALWNFNANGQATGTWVNNCDERIKDGITPIPDPLEAMKKLRGYSWHRLDSGVTGFGFIAQEVQKVFPEAVNNFGQTMKMEDGTEVKDVLSVDTTGVSAALHHEAILALMEKVEELTLKVEALQSGS